MSYDNIFDSFDPVIWHLLHFLRRSRYVYNGLCFPLNFISLSRSKLPDQKRSLLIFYSNMCLFHVGLHSCAHRKLRRIQICHRARRGGQSIPCSGTMRGHRFYHLDEECSDCLAAARVQQ